MTAPAAKKSQTSTLQISEIIYRSPSELKPWPSNPRTHSDRQLAALKAAIKKFGFTMPVLIDDCNVILNGHGRLQAAKELGLSTVPVRVISGLTEAEKCACVPLTCPALVRNRDGIGVKVAAFPRRCLCRLILLGRL
jgi:hypothetical protein